MEDLEEARALLGAQKYQQAAKVLDRMLIMNPGNGELWYLRGIVSLKMRSYDAAQDCFERALMLGRKSKYYQIKGMAHFELFEMDGAVEAFKEALALEPEDPTTNFFLAMCYLFQDDPKADAHMKKARSQDGKKTKQLLLNFYTLFLKDDPRINGIQRKRIEERLKALK
ncbi:tetratricopeptide repeat protein [Candidatus Micrarchaeota archaeon]|nr:tetratricopeptide repeat protein [Candidatus Micrarchaeota archaeon]